MITIWLVASFLNAKEPFAIDNYPYMAQPFCVAALVQWGAKAKSLDLRCMQTLVTKEQFDKMLKDLRT